MPLSLSSLIVRCAAVGALCLLVGATARADKPGAMLSDDSSLEPTVSRLHGLPPPGFLRYELPERQSDDAKAFLAVGAVLLATDQLTFKAFDSDMHESGGVKDPIFRRFNFLADGRTLGTTLVGLYVVGGHAQKDTAKVGMVALANATAATVLLKYVTGKERPDQSDGKVRFHGFSTSDASFPSGHTAAATAVACVLAHDYPKQKLLWYSLAGAVAYSRISSGQHFPSDVFFGAGIGLVSAEGALRHRDGILSWRF